MKLTLHTGCLIALIFAFNVGCKSRSETGAEVKGSKIQKLTEAEKALLAKNGWNEEGLKVYPGYNPFPLMRTEVSVALAKQGLDTKKHMCMQVVQKVGFPEEYMFFQVMKEDCNADGKLFPLKEVSFEFVSIPIDFNSSLQKKSPVLGFFAKLLPLEDAKVGGLFDLNHPEFLLGFWIDDVDHNVKGKPKDIVVSGLCTKTFTSVLNKDFDFSQTCEVKTKDQALVGITYKKPFVQREEVEEVVSQSEYSSREYFNESYQGRNRQEEEGPEQSERPRKRHVPIWFDRQQLGDTAEAVDNLRSGRGGVFSRLGDIRKIEESEALLRGDHDAALRAGSDAALYRGDYNEYRRYQRIDAAKSLLDAVLGGKK